MLHLDTGNTGFMILCTSLVMLMTPGLAFFYGGLVGRKNVLAIMIQSFVSMGWTTVIWYLYGYSLCFSGDWHGIIGNLDKVCRWTIFQVPSPWLRQSAKLPEPYLALPSLYPQDRVRHKTRKRR